jgi:hypothetical protein
MNNNNKQEVLVLGGELTVSGADEAWIKLAAEYPKVICVKFIDDCMAPPSCNPPHIDVLEYEVKSRNGHFHLIIAWDVASTREVKWDVEY